MENLGGVINVLEFIGEVGFTQTAGSGATSGLISIAAGKFQRNDTIFMLVTHKNTGGVTPVITVGATEMLLADDINTTAQGYYVAYAKQIPVDSDFTTKDNAMMGVFGAAGTALVGARNVVTDFNVADWITGAFTISVRTTAIVQNEVVHMTVYRLKGGQSITAPLIEF